MIVFVYVLNCLNYYAAWLAFNWNNVPPHLEKCSISSGTTFHIIWNAVPV